MILNFKLEATRKTFDLDDGADVKNQSEERMEVVILQDIFCREVFIYGTVS